MNIKKIISLILCFTFIFSISTTSHAVYIPPGKDVEVQTVATTPQLTYDPSGGRGSYVYSKSTYPSRCYTYTGNLDTYEDIEAAIIAGLDAWLALKVAAINPKLGIATTAVFTGVASNITRNLNSKIFPGESVSYKVVRYYNPVDANLRQHYYRCNVTYYNQRNEVVGTTVYWLTETVIS